MSKLPITIHRDYTVTFWDVYEQVWNTLPIELLSDDTWATFSAAERKRLWKALGKQSRDFVAG